MIFDSQAYMEIEIRKAAYDSPEFEKLFALASRLPDKNRTAIETLMGYAFDLGVKAGSNMRQDEFWNIL